MCLFTYILAAVKMLNLLAFVDQLDLDSAFDSNKSKMGERMRVIYNFLVPYKLDNIESDDFSNSTDSELNCVLSCIIKGFCWTQKSNFDHFINICCSLSANIYPIKYFLIHPVNDY